MNDHDLQRPGKVRLSLRDVASLGYLGIRTRRARAVLSALGIAIGIATLVVATGISASSQQSLLDRLSALGSNLLTVTGVPNQQPPVQLPEQSVGMAARIGPVTGASAVGNTHLAVERSDRVPPAEASGLTVLAARLDLLPLVGGRLQSGHFLTSASERFPTAVLGSVAATRLGIPALIAGGPTYQVSVDGKAFTVVGVLQQTPLSPDIDDSVLVGWPAAERVLGFDGHPTELYVKAPDAAIPAVRDVLPATVYPASAALVQVSRPSDALAAKQAASSTLDALFLGLAGISLLVGGVGVANTMVISVLERRREIGLRRALGATRRQVRWQFLTESVILANLGGVAGVVMGVVGAAAYAHVQGWPVVLSVPAVLGSLLGTAVIGMLAGAYPAVRAARLAPTEALASG